MPTLRASFEHHYYPPTGTPWPPLHWRGVPCQKIATDLHRLGELVWELKPVQIIETGTAGGGTTLFLADLLWALDDYEWNGPRRIWTVDTEARVSNEVARHPCVKWRHGSSTDPELVADAERQATRLADWGWPVLVILDSDHHAAHVAAELAAYAPLVTPNSYLICEDMNLGRSVMLEHGPGPADAVDAFLAEYPGQWEVATDWEPPLTTNPGGWLRRLI